MRATRTCTAASPEGGILVRIVASRPVDDRLLPEEVVANIRLDPPLLMGENSRALFLGLLLEGGAKVFESIGRRRWFDAR
jgi:hypothetical protein